MFGGGIRQSGGLAASANYALDHHLPKLPGTHERARFLARGLAELGVRLMLPVETSELALSISSALLADPFPPQICSGSTQHHSASPSTTFQSRLALVTSTWEPLASWCTIRSLKQPSTTSSRS